MSKIDLTPLIAIKPHARQVAWQKLEYYNAIYFGLNTFTGKDSGDGTVSVSKFKLKQADVAGWVSLCKKSGSSGIIFTAKSDDGFCLFNSKYTDYTVMQSPYGKDLLAELAEECRVQGLKFGLRISLLDRHENSYGSAEYNDFFANQLTELLTNYGAICEVMLDPARPDAKFNKVQEYDFDRYQSIVRKLQNNAVVSLCGDDVRAVGMKIEHSREQEWCVVDSKLLQCYKLKSMAKQYNKEADLSALDLGSRDVALAAEQLVWCPAECYFGILNGGNYHSTTKEMVSGVRTLEQMINIYYSTVGNNVNLIIGTPPTKAGAMSQKVSDRLLEFGAVIRKDFAEEIPARLIRYRNPKGEVVYDITPTKSGATKFKLCEAIANGQLVEEFSIIAETADGQLVVVHEGLTIGSLTIVSILNNQYVKFRLVITKSRKEVEGLQIKLF